MKTSGKQYPIYLLSAVLFSFLFYAAYTQFQRVERCEWQNTVGPLDPTIPTTMDDIYLPKLSELSYWWRISWDKFAELRHMSAYEFWRPTLAHISTAPLPMGVGSCSVVGNSGNLLGSGYGEKIDANDWVIRVNEAPTEGYEGDVGKKTTLHFIQVYSSQNILESGRKLRSDIDTLFVIFNAEQKRWLDEHRKSTLAAIPNDKLRILHPAFFHSVDRGWLAGSSPSTGLLAVALAMRHCKKVEVFGFGANANGHWDHYFKPMEARPVTAHSADRESDIRYCLAKSKRISVFSGVR
jgi:hypothetical protein